MQQLSPATGPSRLDCAWELVDTLPPIMWHIRRAMREHRRGLSMPQFRAMCMIANGSPISLSEVAEQLALSLPTTSRIVTGLVNKGLLKRSDSKQDRRQMSLGITGRGQAVLNIAWSAAQDSMAKELKSFDDEQRITVVEAMRLLKQVFGSLGVAKINDE